MKSFFAALALAVVALGIGLAPSDADARRLGGGGAAGMQRSLPARPDAGRPTAPPTASPAAPPTAGMPAAAPKRSWLGPIAGLAAGLGLAALMSHLGLGAEFGSFLLLLIVGVAAFAAIRFMLRRMNPAPAYGGAAGAYAGPQSYSGPTGATATDAIAARSAYAPAAGATSTAAAATALPSDFDAAAFERIAKTLFIRLQAANDAGDLNDLRAFTTPELFAAVRLDLQDRGAKTQRTDVVKIDAEVLDIATENGQQVVSVRFHGLVREDVDAAAEPYDEVWHVVRPVDASRQWAIAGIQQMA
jgi:predicted lipid-binding transport protein (Tim44 family)